MAKAKKFSAEFDGMWRRLTGRTPQVLARTADTKVGEIQKAAKLSTKDIAQKVGVSERTVKGWQSGKTQPRGQTAAKLDRVMTDALVKREEQRRERSVRRGGAPEPKPTVPGRVSVNGAVRVGKETRTRTRQTYTIRAGEGNVTQKDIERVLAAAESGSSALVAAEAGRLIALAWGVEESAEYEITFPGGVDIL